MAMDMATWRRELHSALDPGAVVDVMQRFMESLSEAELDAFPSTLLGMPRTAEQVTTWAFELQTDWLDSSSGDGPTILTLGKISLVFAEASRRIAQLSTPRDSRPFRERWRW
jgi:hypothetical protein